MLSLWATKNILEGDFGIKHLWWHGDHISWATSGGICGLRVSPNHEQQLDSLNSRRRATRGGAVEGGGAVRAAAAVDVDGGEGKQQAERGEATVGGGTISGVRCSRTFRQPYQRLASSAAAGGVRSSARHMPSASLSAASSRRPAKASSVSTVRCLAISATAAAAASFFLGVAATAPPSTLAAGEVEIGVPFIWACRIVPTEATGKTTAKKPVKAVLISTRNGLETHQIGGKNRTNKKERTGATKMEAQTQSLPKIQKNTQNLFLK